MASEKPRVGDLIALAEQSRKAFNNPRASSSSSSGSVGNGSGQPQLLVRSPTGYESGVAVGMYKDKSAQFRVGIVVGFMLKTRVRRWATKLLKKIRDN